MRKKWQPVEDAGERYLERIAADLERWQRNKDRLDVLRTEADREQERNAGFVARAVATAIDHGLLDELLSGEMRMAPAERQLLVRSTLSRTALEQLLALDQGTELTTGPTRVNLCTQEPGVILTSPAPQGSRAGIRNIYRRVLGTGKQFTGKLLSLNTCPPVAGKLVLSQWPSVMTFEGLVDPDSLTPRVELEVFAKS